MADHRHDVEIGDKLLGCRHRLSRTALVIKSHQLKATARQHRSLGIRMLNGKPRTIEHVLARRCLIACQRCHEPDFDDWLGSSTTTSHEKRNVHEGAQSIDRSP